MDDRKKTKRISLEDLAKPSFKAQILSLLVPFASAMAILLLLAIFIAPKKAYELMTLSVSAFFALGKFIVFVPVIPDVFPNIKISFSIWNMVAMIIFMDTCTAILLGYNIHLLTKLKWLGAKFKSIRTDCFYLLEASPWMKKGASVAVALFVAFPVAGTGAVSGTFLAYLLGFKRLYTIFLIFMGSVFGTVPLGLGALYMKKNLKDVLEDPVYFFISLGIMIVFLVWASYKMKRMIDEQKKKNPLFGKGEMEVPA
ncbi:MAG: small multi-drug export protein [Candidatus Brocadiae bacterium]|nr:small multi-drug export protein [Candidatus Brocadiia bacterium]